MEENDRQTFRRFLIGFVIICGCSGVMHYFLVSRGAIKSYRVKPSYQQGATESVEAPKKLAEKPVEGTVSATSFDKFFLKSGEKNLTFKVGDQTMPQVGDHLRVFHSDEDPPTAMRLEKLQL